MTENPHQLTAEQAEQLRAYLLERLSTEKPAPNSLNHLAFQSDFMQKHAKMIGQGTKQEVYISSGAYRLFKEIWEDYEKNYQE